ncbi:hypothetical protein M3182_24245 [Mesobacillus maritimus]|uniref:hypothetical protein n=1 Tax=Mesobacillus maritimus TaxID=1643336 RepID=UPI002041FEB5|nr:hypothetical protein [Mesobacillus maritimus]MCM3588766.1 hypothetical protein [Mesobacillus maritimus]MCM3669414.1 hypothetical protein [Mesobacillus maritimus]
MKEHIGYCHQCGKEIFCLDGFFNGIHLNSKKILCFKCAEQDSALKEEQNNSSLDL